MAGFCAGALAIMLLMGGLFVVSTQLADHTRAQETWQVKLFEESSINNGFESPKPEKYVDDWVRTLPTKCDIVATSARNVYFYRCS
jgi:hypothetical protein